MLWLPAEATPLTAMTLILISFVTSSISAAFGLGGGVAMLIALLSLTPPIVALPVHALVQIGSNAGRAWMLRPFIMTGVVRWFIPGSLIGVLLASQVIVILPTRWLQLVLATFILWTVWAPKISAIAVPEKAYLGVGGVTSFATMFLGATGPLLAAFLSPARYGRDRTVATHAACMSLQHLIKVTAFGFLGFVLTEWLPLVIAMIVSGLVGTWLGRALLQRLPEATFRWVFRCVLTVLALRLLFNALWNY
ncbi:MAG: sulfite exporter TauE/SafE family protein [Granulosicoccus sp.]|nr:sulfite exporter TauE/SafE family protein [Granulosicoccus sp.]